MTSELLKNLTEGNYVFQLTDNMKVDKPLEGLPPYPKMYALPPTELVYDEETKRTRLVRCIKGVSYIFDDEQKDKGISEKTMKGDNVWRPQFIWGTLTLKYPQDAEKIKRLLLSDRFAGKTQKYDSARQPEYKLVDDTLEKKNLIERFKREQEAYEKAVEASKNFKNIETHCRFLEIPFEENGRKRSEDDIITDYIIAARKNPELFLRTFGDPDVDLQVLIKNAIDSGIVDITSSPGNAIWSDTKGTITKIKGDAVKALMKYSESPEGKRFLEKIKVMSSK